MDRSIHLNFRMLGVLIFCVVLALNVHADQWKMNQKGNSYAASHRNRKSGYHHKKMRLDRMKRSVNSRTEYDLEAGSGSRRLSSGPQDACTHWSQIFYFFTYISQLVMLLLSFLIISASLRLTASVTHEKGRNT